ncbi:MAG: hypothetical protein PUA94_00340 [Bacteroidales bacterium]|nr:hypothetical protein [Bacteroidales bacterium]
MTYIELINEFWQQDRFKPFNDTDMRLYFFLLNECNIRKWLNPYELQTQYLEAMLRIKRKAIAEARNRLKQRGLIDFKAKTNNPTVYAINNVKLSNHLLAELFPHGNNQDTIKEQSTVQSRNNEETCNIEYKTKEKDLLEKLSDESKKKALTPFEMIGEYRRTSGNPGYLKFLDWLEASAPYVSHHIKPLSEDEFERLRAQFGSRAITVNIHNIENRKDLRTKYASLYRTLINWCKRE